ncbi:MAG: hypothetical protein KDD67_07660 [Ignavibacteriae bacterium]|nr:hypothetical protein [Ignavibacteriota bacterium]MCB9216192.1 hypothetical protein [Ignavibacteria bacterium]
MNGTSAELQNKYARMSKTAMIAGLVGVALLAVGWVTQPDKFYESYIFGYAYWITVTLGLIGWTLLHNLTAGKWGFTIRRFLQAGTFNGSALSPLILMAVLFLPIIIGSDHLYGTWMDAKPDDHVLAAKAFYLNEPFWYARLIFYFLFWIFLTMTLRRLLLKEEKTLDTTRSNMRTIQRLSGGGLVLFMLTVNFAMTDWMMSLEPHWFSTMYGIIFLIGGAISAIALCNGMTVTSSSYSPFSKYLDTKTYHDLGNLMFALTVFWAYVSFSQYMIIWSANIGEEAGWFLKRITGWKEVIGYGLLVFHFIFPFLVLIQRKWKRDPQRLKRMALYILSVHFLDMLWQIKPAFQEVGATGDLNFHWLDIAAVLGIGGLWLWLFLSGLAKMKEPLLPAHDPRMRGAKPVVDDHAATANV